MGVRPIFQVFETFDDIVAVLDRRGVAVFGNSSWRTLCEKRAIPDRGIGRPYPIPTPCAAGFRRVLAGGTNQYEGSCVVAVGASRQSYQLSVAPLPSTQYAVVRLLPRADPHPSPPAEYLFAAHDLRNVAASWRQLESLLREKKSGAIALNTCVSVVASLRHAGGVVALLPAAEESQLGPWSLCDVLDETARAFALLCHIPWHFRYERCDEQLLCDGDPLPFQRVVMNLLWNARSAMPEGGTVCLTASEKVEGRPRRRVASVEIAGEGRGLCPAEVKRLFYDQVTEPLCRTATGLGLIELLAFLRTRRDVRVRVESQEGQGTRVAVRMPARLALQKRSLAEKFVPVPSAGAKSRSAIVLENDSGSLEYYASVLENAGWRVSRARSVVALSEILSGVEHSTLVVSDVLLDEGNGVVLATALRRKYPKLRFVFLTGIPRKIARATFELGPWARVLSMPLDQDLLLGTCEELVARPS